MKYIHSANLVHRDIKPANILINSDCSIRMADFGLSRSLEGVKNTLQNFVGLKSHNRQDRRLEEIRTKEDPDNQEEIDAME